MKKLEEWYELLRDRASDEQIYEELHNEYGTQFMSSNIVDYNMKWLKWFYDKARIMLYNNPKEDLESYMNDIINCTYKPIVIGDINTKYEINEIGTVRDVFTKRHIHPRKGGHNYMRITLSINEEKREFRLHALVAKAFIPNPDNLPEINHIDCNKSNNWYRNLEWCTHSYNMDHARVHGLIVRGEQSWNAAYTTDQVIKICEDLRDHPELTCAEIAELNDTTTSSVIEIYRKKKWKWISENYEFPNRKRGGRPGELNKSNKYSEELVDSVCKDMANGLGGRAIGIKYNNPSLEYLVSDIRSGERWVNKAKEYGLLGSKGVMGHPYTRPADLVDKLNKAIESNPDIGIKDLLSIGNMEDNKENRHYLSMFKFGCRNKLKKIGKL